MDEKDLEQMRDSMNEWDRIEDAVSRSVIVFHTTLYYAATEARRATAHAEMVRAERDGNVVIDHPDLPAREWNTRKWPEPVRKAIIAMWSVPHVR